MGTRDEVLRAVVSRHRSSTRAEKGRILTEFAEISGYHRKHAERLLRSEDVVVRSRPRPERRVYDDAVGVALVVLWEAADRICGKRLRPLIPAMERNGHLALTKEGQFPLQRLIAEQLLRGLSTTGCKLGEAHGG